MDAVERAVATILQREGYWVRALQGRRNRPKTLSFPTPPRDL